MRIENRRLAELTPYRANAKKHDAAQVANVAESVRQFGFVQPVVVDRDGVIASLSVAAFLFLFSHSSQLSTEIRLLVRCTASLLLVLLLLVLLPFQSQMEPTVRSSPPLLPLQLQLLPTEAPMEP